MFLYDLIDDPKQLPLFEHLYRTYRTSLYRIVLNVLHDPHLAEDALAEAFIKIAKNMEKISSLSGQVRKRYLIIIVRNTAIDFFRKRQHQEGIIDFVEALPQNEAAYSMDEAYFSQEGYDRLLQAIGTLPPIYRDVLELYYLHGNSAAEIASLLNLQEDTVFARLSRGRKQLAQALEQGKEEATQ